MTIAEWIIMVILAITLLVFLILGVILIVKLIKISDQAKKVVETGQNVANKAEDVVDNVKDMTSVGRLAKGYVREYVGEKLFGRHIDESEDDYYEARPKKHTRTHGRRNKKSVK